MSEQKKIADWLETAGKKSPLTPTFPESEKFQLGLRLILEELFEAAESGPDSDVLLFLDEVIDSARELIQKVRSRNRTDGDLKEFRDACADLRVVLGNIIHFAGTNQKFDEDFNAVMESNFSKFCSSEKQAEETINAYKNGKHPNKMGEKIDCYHEKVGNYWIVKRKGDDKVLKSIGFVEPNFN